MDISVVLCTYNRSASLSQVLKDLASLRVPESMSYEVIVVDNNSSDDTKAVVDAASRETPDTFEYVFESRQGKAFALNTGVALATGSIIAFTDDDVSVHPDWLAEIKRTFDLRRCFGVGGRIVPVWHSQAPWWYEDCGPFRLAPVIVQLEMGDVACDLKTPAWGANMAFQRSAFDKYGLFRTDLGPSGYSLLRGEDSEYWWRLIDGGEKLVYAPSAIVYHPVEEKRTTQQYFLSWYFDQGRTMARRTEIPEGVVQLFGIPRYLLRQLVENFGRWVLCLHPKRRFYYKLEVYKTAGHAFEVRQGAEKTPTKR